MKKIVLITGATSGIGLATAKLLGQNGYKVLINGIDKEAGEIAIKQLVASGIEAEAYYFDVTNEVEVNKNFKLIEERYGKLDGLVNNAGALGGRCRFEDMSTEFYKKVMNLNLDSVFYVSRPAIKLLKKGTNPSIINFTSIAGYNGGGPGAGVYGTAKGAVIVLTRAMAKDLAEYGIRVNAVSPGTINTPFHQATLAANPAIFEAWKNNILMKRVGEPEEVAGVIEFLLSSKASFITGEVIQINGGQDFM